VCGMVTDRVSVAVPIRKWTAALVYASIAVVLLPLGFALDPGAIQLALIGVGAFFAAGTTGPTGAMVASLTPASLRATAFGTLTLVNNLLGLAAGPFVIGLLADHMGLVDAMKFAPLVSAIAIVALVVGRRTYPSSVLKVGPTCS
jgi:MFS family permease